MVRKGKEEKLSSTGSSSGLKEEEGLSEVAAPGVDPVTAQAQLSPCFQPTRTRALRDVAWSTGSFCPAASGCVAVALEFTESLTLKARGRAARQ